MDNQNDDRYHALKYTLNHAYERATQGKGHERHANDKAFQNQPIVTECEALGIAGNIYQIRKKSLELLRFEEAERQINELLDVIVYACATIVHLRGVQIKEEERICKNSTPDNRQDAMNAH